MNILSPVRIAFYLAIFTIFPAFGASAQQVMPLYPGAIPNSRPAADSGYTDAEGNAFRVSRPELIAFLPTRRASSDDQGGRRRRQAVGKTRGREPGSAGVDSGTSDDNEKGLLKIHRHVGGGAAVVICPGGGYGALVMDREGYRVARELNKQGVTCFVLKYRLPDTATVVDPSMAPLQDAQMALKTIRENAARWKINPNKIGIMGFSAGGHLAATAGTHFDKSYIDNKENTSLRPDFLILVYPVISMLDSLGHKGSRENLLGIPATVTVEKDRLATNDPRQAPGREKELEFSNELHITPETPPTFLLHATDDEMVAVGNSLVFYEGELKNGVSSGMHIFAKGRHGFLAEPAKSDWLSYAIGWLAENGWL